jgi:hypothetical protein
MLRQRLDDVLAEAEQANADWRQACDEAYDPGSPDPKACERHADAVESVMRLAVDVIADMVDRVDAGEDVEIAPAAPEVLVMQWDGGPDRESLDLAEDLVEHEQAFTVCPHCWTPAVSGGVLEIDRRTWLNSGRLDSEPLAANCSVPAPSSWLPQITFVTKTDTEYVTAGYLCGTCDRPVALPEWMKEGWE